MAEPAVRAFVLTAWILAGIVVVLTRVTVPDADTQGGSGEDSEDDQRWESKRPVHDEGVETQSTDVRTRTRHAGESLSLEDLPPDLLLANAVLTHGSILLVLGLAVMFSGVPLNVLGADSSAVDAMTISTGVVAGLVLYLVDEVLSLGMKHVGFVPAEFLRSALAPSSLRGWVILFLGILPLVSVAEEVLFRGALIGATIALGFSPLVVILASSLLFGVAHGVQGVGGIVVAGALGLGLGIVFVWTQSLLVVGIAHYVVNALEFLVHERFDSTI